MRIKQEKALKWGLYCNCLYIFFLFLFMPDGINIKNIAITSLLSFSALLLGVLCFRNWKSLKKINKTAKVLFYLVFFWGIVVVVRAFSLSIQDWVTNFGNIYMAFAWLMPLTLILGLNIKNWSIVFEVISFMFSLMILGFLVLPFFDYNEEWVLLLRPVIFVLLIGVYQFKSTLRFKTYLIIFLYLVSMFFFSSRRVDQLYLFLTFGVLLLDKLMSIRLKKPLIKYIFASFILVLILIFTVGYEHVSNLIAMVINFQDSRTFLFTELFLDMSFSEELFGRGSLGTYYSDYFERTRRYYEAVGRTGWAGDVPDRISTEVGYLQMILKGGFTLFILNISIFSYAIYLGIFRSKSKFIKRLSYYIILITIISIVEFRPTFTPMFIVFWMAIGTIWNKEYRQMNDDEIESLIKFK